jgi:hypothetical protein
MVKRGRPKKPGKRHPGGKLIQPRPPERGEDAQRVAVDARRRIMGLPDTQEARVTALTPMAEDALGRCILALVTGDDAKRRQNALWSTWCAIGAARRNALQRDVGIAASPQAAAIAMMPEPMQANDAHSIDLRTADERDEAAKRVWARWKAALDDLPQGQRIALKSHLGGYLLPLWDDSTKRPTPAGLIAFTGLRAVHGRIA